MNKIFKLEAITIPDAWFQLVYNIMGEKTYMIDKGSYEGQYRLEFDYVSLIIHQPWCTPMIPVFPEHMNYPKPIEDEEYINQYFANYLMNDQIENNEAYTYGMWIKPGIKRVINQLNNAPGNNQATINIGGYYKKNNEYINSDESTDPPCLRLIDFRLDQQSVLHMAVTFRSNDLWSGFPVNIPGLELVKQYVAQELNVKNGKIIYNSKGLHLYDHIFEMAANRLGKNIENYENINECLKEKR